MKPFTEKGALAIQKLKERYKRYTRSKRTIEAYVSWLVRVEGYEPERVAKLLQIEPLAVGAMVTEHDKRIDEGVEIL